MATITLLRRQAASDYLFAKHGVARSRQTLAKYACLGVGPTFQYLGRVPVDTPAALDEWVDSMLSEPTRSSSKAPPSAACGGRDDR